MTWCYHRWREEGDSGEKCSSQDILCLEREGGKEGESWGDSAKIPWTTNTKCQQYTHTYTRTTFLSINRKCFVHIFYVAVNLYHKPFVYFRGCESPVHETFFLCIGFRLYFRLARPLAKLTSQPLKSLWICFSAACLNTTDELSENAVQ